VGHTEEQIQGKMNGGQLNLLHTALCTRFTQTSPKAIMEKIHELNGVINCFSNGVPSREQWKECSSCMHIGDDREFEMMREP